MISGCSLGEGGDRQRLVESEEGVVNSEMRDRDWRLEMTEVGDIQ